MLAWNDAVIVFFLFFAIFFEIFYYASGGNETERQFLFSLFLDLFQPISAWNEVIMAFFDFFEFLSLFFCNFLQPVRSEGNGKTIFIFPLSQHFPTYFCLKWIHNCFFFNLLNFFAIFLEFYITRQFGTKRNDTIIFLFPLWAFSILFWLEMKPQLYFLIFLNFLLFFWNFLLPVRSEGNGKTIFIFSLSRHFPTYFGLKWSHTGIF